MYWLLLDARDLDAARFIGHHPKELLESHREVQVLGKQFKSLLATEHSDSMNIIALYASPREPTAKQNFQIRAVETSSVLLLEDGREI